jgi:glycine/D-amino acid oxidase-like deaminating enzyme
MVSCMKLRLGAPIWLNGVRQRRRYPSLQNWQRSDVVIVGGGMTGAGIARVLAEAGVDVALLEGSLVGRGSTAASTALLMQETDEDLRRLEASYGRARASRIWQLSRESVRDLVATLSRLRIACDVQARDTIYYTRNPEKVEDLYAEYQRRRRAGFSARWLDPAALSAVTGIAGEGAIQSRGNAQLDPYRACVGLLNAAAARGARIFESSEVERIEVSRTGVIVRTDGGAIAAGHVIIATGYATPAFALLAGRFTMKHTYVLATEPVTAAERRRLGFGELLLWDTERPYHYARWTPDHRLVLGGNDRALLPPARRRQAFATNTRRLREYFDHLLPAFEEIAIDSAWEGLFASTPDGLPYIGTHRRYPRHLFALGYGGNGMTFGFLAGRLLLDSLQTANNPDLQLFAFNRLRSTR